MREYSRFFMKREKTLTIYCDESGDFGTFDEKSPVYCMSLIMFSSEDDATPYLSEFHRRYHSKPGGDSPFHAGPIIRGEDPYRERTRGERLELFDIAFDLALSSPISAINLCVKKEETDVVGALAKQLTSAIFSHLDYLRSFNQIVFVYDNGQIQLKTMLAVIFNAYFLNFKMILALQSEQPLLQVADLMVTLTLLDYKVR